jgi:2-polyprenyl-6-methoxyphenol hydroxylase-like FAD-dependent oxidoreductase
MLLDAAVARGAELECGVTIKHTHNVGKRVLLKAEDGSERGPFDLLVIASGARSSLRKQLGLVRREQAYPWGALWFVADDEQRKHANCLRQVANGTRRFLGLLPSGLEPESLRPAVPKLSLFWSVRMSDVDEFRRSDLGRWKAEVLGYEPDAESILDQIESTEQLLAAPYWDVVLDAWHTHNSVCIGDAGHAMSPQLGQGCNLALCDAIALAYCLDGTSSLATALAMFSARRREHLAYYQFASRWLTPFFQSDLTPLGPLRDWGMGIACGIPALRRRMLLTMAGVGRGILASPLALPAVTNSP